eukprot:CAMPEP_0196595112 /NCGR_PEP_ID=MMETSP1081-20130531/80214_1 /TAXON_ID=36882 /ORGANISM="Pyramimonas amylifera, Strain CCMP720" /LENGTH=108 /DNA_ID=CAMNT_0041919575 /DNA_START=101 /DNA_END=427 /DNA_ORIENTATION=-
MCAVNVYGGLMLTKSVLEENDVLYDEETLKKDFLKTFNKGNASCRSRVVDGCLAAPGDEDTVCTLRQFREHQERLEDPKRRPNRCSGAPKQFDASHDLDADREINSVL